MHRVPRLMWRTKAKSLQVFFFLFTPPTLTITPLTHPSLPPTLLRTSNKSKHSNHKVTQCWWQSEDACCMQIKVSKLLTAAGASAVCILSADCRRPGRRGRRGGEKKKKEREKRENAWHAHKMAAWINKSIAVRPWPSAAGATPALPPDTFLFSAHAPLRSATSERPRERPRSVPRW